MERTGLLLKFSGDGLAVRGVPIYELGDTLVAVQRILHKTYLYEQGRLGSGMPLRKAERQQLSLQILDRERSSDLYVLAPFLADPVVQLLIGSVLEVGLGSLLQYALQRVVAGPPSPGHQANLEASNVAGSFLAGAIYAETVQITNHINNIGGVETIELLPTGPVRAPSVLLTPETQGYTRDLANRTVYGPPQEIVGYVTRLHPNRLMADIKVAPGHFVRVHMNPDAFDFVRYRTGPEEDLLFRGWPVLRLGRDNMKVREFEAESAETAI